MLSCAPMRDSSYHQQAEHKALSPLSGELLLMPLLDGNSSRFSLTDQGSPSSLGLQIQTKVPKA